VIVGGRRLDILLIEAVFALAFESSTVFISTSPLSGAIHGSRFLATRASMSTSLKANTKDEKCKDHCIESVVTCVGVTTPPSSGP